MYVHFRLRHLSCHLFGKELLTLCVLFVINIFVISVISHCGLEDMIVVVIVLVPGQCLLFTLIMMFFCLFFIFSRNIYELSRSGHSLFRFKYVNSKCNSAQEKFEK